MANKLAKEGLVTITPYKGIQLTEVRKNLQLQTK